MKVYVLIAKSNPNEDYGDIRGVYATLKQAQSHAKLVSSMGDYPDIIESNLVGEE